MTHQETRRRQLHFAKLFQFAKQVAELKISLLKIQRSAQNLLKLPPMPMSDNEILDACNQIDYEEFISKLSVRARKTLHRLKVRDSASLAALTVRKLENTTNCGETTVAAIVGRFAEYGISLPEHTAAEAL